MPSFSAYIMLTKLLSKDECAKCRICCAFDSYDIWETPTITDDVREIISSEILPEQEYLHKGEATMLKLNREEKEDLYYCTMLDKSSGCKLGDRKPFDCRIWPLRIMTFGGKRVITVSPICPVVMKKPLEDVVTVAKELAPLIFEQADIHPEFVKNYEPGYTIVVIEEKNQKSNERDRVNE